jgi:hypothetical protein
MMARKTSVLDDANYSEGGDETSKEINPLEALKQNLNTIGAPPKPALPSAREAVATSVSAGFVDRSGKIADRPNITVQAATPPYKKPGRRQIIGRTVQWSFKVRPVIDDYLAELHEDSKLTKSEIIEQSIAAFHQNYFSKKGVKF